MDYNYTNKRVLCILLNYDTICPIVNNIVTFEQGYSKLRTYKVGENNIGATKCEIILLCYI